MPGTQNSLRILSCLACMLVIVSAAATSVEAQDARLARLLDEANRRTASGESADIVEQWLTQAMQANGMATTAPAWDVYGQKLWQAAQDAPDMTPASAFVVSIEESTTHDSRDVVANAGTGNPPSFVPTPAVPTANP